MIAEGPTADIDNVIGQSFRIAGAPDWVSRSKVKNIERQGVAPTTCLLFERWVHVPSSTHYSRLVRRLESSRAVQELSRIEISFDPLIERVCVHAVSIFRDGTLSQHAASEAFELLRRENRMETGVINGAITAILVLRDVRIGDVLDVEYSITSRSELFPGHAHLIQAVGDRQPIGRFKVVWLDYPGNDPRVLQTSDALSYSENTVDGLVMRQWEAAGLQADEPEPLLPSDILPYELLQITTFACWSQIINCLLPAWQQEPGDKSELDHEVWAIRQSAGSDPARRLEAAVNLAVHVVRYQAYSPGLLAMVPQNLSEVWRRRFGDCKEKSLLLVWLLRELGIKADPVLVNTDMGSGLARWLPSPAVFNHVVVRIDFDGGELWIDPTNTYRGGSPASWKELPFALGLPLKQGADQLIAIPSAEIGTSYLKTREHLKLDSKSRQCELSLEMCFGGMRADWLRGFVDSQGVGGLRKLAESMLERSRPNLIWDDDPTFADDRSANECVVIYKGKMAGALKPDPQYARNLMGIFPFSFAGALVVPDGKQRKNAMAIPFPQAIEHEIIVEHPELRKKDQPTQTFRAPSFLFRCGSRLERGMPVYWFSYASLIDRVLPDALAEYRRAIMQVVNALELSIQIKSTERRNIQSNDPELTWGGGISSPEVARRNVRVEGTNIGRFVVIGFVVAGLLIRFIMMFFT